MFKADYIEVHYQPSDFIERQGTYSSIERYLKNGYHVQVNRNGYWLLVCPSKVIVAVNCGAYGTYTYDMKNSILEFYDRSKISAKLVETFKKDVVDGRITILADEFGYSIE